MGLNNLIEGLEILRLYYKNPNGYHIGSEHDTIYMYVTNVPLIAVHIQAMIDNGWVQNVSRSSECGKMVVSDYDPEESWVFYT